MNIRIFKYLCSKLRLTFVCLLGGAEGGVKGHMGSPRMEKQTLTTELAAVKIKKEDAMDKKGSGGKERQGRLGKDVMR